MTLSPGQQNKRVTEFLVEAWCLDCPKERSTAICSKKTVYSWALSHSTLVGHTVKVMNQTTRTFEGTK